MADLTVKQALDDLRVAWSPNSVFGSFSIEECEHRLGALIAAVRAEDKEFCRELVEAQICRAEEAEAENRRLRAVLESLVRECYDDGHSRTDGLGDACDRRGQVIRCGICEALIDARVALSDRWTGCPVADLKHMKTVSGTVWCPMTETDPWAALAALIKFNTTDPWVLVGAFTSVVEQAEAAEADNQRLREALERYGKHDERCGVNRCRICGGWHWRVRDIGMGYHCSVGSGVVSKQHSNDNSFRVSDCSCGFAGVSRG